MLLPLMVVAMTSMICLDSRNDIKLNIIKSISANESVVMNAMSHNSKSKRFHPRSLS